MSSLERCPLFRVSFLERFHCIVIVLGSVSSAVSSWAKNELYGIPLQCGVGLA